MIARQQNACFIYSCLAHLLILSLFIFGFEFIAPLPVFENSNKNDVISAVVLGDVTTSKIVTPRAATLTPTPKVEKPESQPVKAKPTPSPTKAISIAKPQPKVVKPKNFFVNDLLADIKQQTEQKKKLKQKTLTSQFQKTLRAQAEQSLRQNLLKEEIKLQSAQAQQAQGIVDKYKALILQAISEHWIIPTQSSRNLYSELMIRLAPDGMVLDVQITKSSGDPALDSSARAAVLKASPLPVPREAQAFAAFKQFVLRASPKDIINSVT